MDVLVGLICLLAALLMVLAAVAVVGHGLWLLAAAMFGSDRPGKHEQRRHRWRAVDCADCGERYSEAQWEFCPQCGLHPLSDLAKELGDLEGAAATMQRLRDAGDISADISEVAQESIEARLVTLRKSQRRARQTADVPAPKVAHAPPQWTTPSEPAAAPAPAPALPIVPEVYDGKLEPALAEPAAHLPDIAAGPPVDVTPAMPRRSFAEWMAVFLEENNILWGELIGGSLIIGCSIALVISLWQTIEQIPLFPFLLFTAITSALFGAGFYTLHHWKLEATSRGLLLIGTLLVPLDFLVLAGLTIGAVPGVLDYGAALAALAFFGFCLHRSTRILVQAPLGAGVPATWLVTGAMLVSAAAQLLAPSWRDHETLLSLLPVLAQAAALGWILLGLHRIEAWSVGQLVALLIALGCVSFACVTMLCFILYRADPMPAVLVHLAPALTLLGVPILIAGIMTQQRLTRSAEQRGLWGTLGTALALTGMFVMLGGFAAALPDIEYRWLSGLVNIATLLAAAWVLRVPMLHVPAQVYLAVLAVTGWSTPRELEAIIQHPHAMLRLTGLFMLQALAAECWMRLGRNRSSAMLPR
jgi:hypothetical protein